jgi:hypothetical protein
MGWNGPYPQLQTVMVVLWIAAAVTLFGLFQARSHKRQELVRRFFLSPDWAYNHEIGYVPLSEIVHNKPYDFVLFAGNVLAKMSYGYTVAEAPKDFTPTFLITSSKFSFHLMGESRDPDEGGVVIDKWSGEVFRVERTEVGELSYSHIEDFSNPRDLAIILDMNGAFDKQYANNSKSGDAGVENA